jgi:hypothetical protein
MPPVLESQTNAVMSAAGIPWLMLPPLPDSEKAVAHRNSIGFGVSFFAAALPFDNLRKNFVFLPAKTVPILTSSSFMAWPGMVPGVTLFVR